MNAEPEPRLAAASSTARDCSASNAPCSQNTSIQRALRSAGREHLAADEIDVVVGAPLVLGRDDVGAEEGDVVGERSGDARRGVASDPTVSP